MKKHIYILTLFTILVSISGCGNKAIQKAYTEGWNNGYDEGYKEGYKNGQYDGVDDDSEVFYDELRNNPYDYLDMDEVIDEYLSDHDYVIEEYIEENY